MDAIEARDENLSATLDLFSKLNNHSACCSDNFSCLCCLRNINIRKDIRYPVKDKIMPSMQI